MACARCEKRGQTWRGDAPICGFDAAGVFNPGNWNCATLNALRDLADDHLPGAHGVGTAGGRLWHDDYNVGVIGAAEEADGRGGGFVVLRWYKSRGRTEAALLWRLLDDVPRPITLAEAEAALGVPRGLEPRE